MSIRKLSWIGLLVIASIVAAAGAYYLDYYVFSAPAGDDNHPPSRPLLASLTSSNRAALVFDEPEVDLGAVRDRISHRFSYRNVSKIPVSITDVRPSCRCAVSKPDRTILQPEESGSVTLEADVTQKEPGAHRLLLSVDYEYGESKEKAMATASLRVVYQPDFYITPRHLNITVTEGAQATVNITLIDYRKESLKILKNRPSSSTLGAKISESPSEYLPGWRHVIEVAYTDPPKETRRHFPEQILIETSDPQLSLLTIPVEVNRLERLRLAPQVVTLQPGRTVEIILRDSLGQKIILAESETSGLAILSFTKEGEPTKRLSLSLPPGQADSSKYPATIWIRVSKPCQRRLPIRVSLAAPKGT